jgi:hypothetical protein
MTDRVCSFEGCGRKHNAASYCATHYLQYRKGQKLTPVKTAAKPGGPYPLRLDSHGYLVITVRPDLSKPSTTELIHRLVVEQHLGRKLLPGENVHHINGDRLDNRIENLEVWNTMQPAGQRAEDKIKFAKEILEMYKDYDFWRDAF